MIGLEQTVVPLIGKNEFGIESSTIIVSFIASFGAIKAVLNIFAGNLSDKWANFYWGWIAGKSLLGIGTALVYPTLLAAISDVANPKWRATSLGVYRFWRDLGFVFGAIGIGFIADLFGLNVAIHLVAFLAKASGIFVLAIMKETSRLR